MFENIESLLIEAREMRLIALGLMIVISAIIGASAYGVEKGHYGKSRYVFKFKKNFEDRIIKKSKKLYLYLEVVELTPDGLERRRPDLTRKVEVYSEDSAIELGHTLMNGYYAETSVELRDDLIGENAKSTNIVVSYRGKEGVFKNKIEFKL